MTHSPTFKDQFMFDLEQEETTNYKKAEDPIKSQFVSRVVKSKEAIENNTEEYKKILSFTSMSIKSMSNVYYKSCSFLEISDIEQIKSSLNNYLHKNDNIKEFKKALIEDLEGFQKQIKTGYVKKFEELAKEKQTHEKHLMILEVEKHKLIMERLSKVVWPYDNKTKEYDAKIATLQLKVQKLTNKIEELKKMKPIANEKDILIYQMHLKEKYLK